MVARVCAASEDELRLIARLVVYGTESCHRDDDIAVLHHDGNVVRLPQSDFFRPFADEWPRPSPTMLPKSKPASFRLSPVSPYVVVRGAASVLPTLFGLLNTIC